MQIHTVIDDNLFQQALQASGLPDTQAMLEEALRALIASKSPPQDKAGCLNQLARGSLPFEQERIEDTNTATRWLAHWRGGLLGRETPAPEDERARHLLNKHLR